MEEAIEIIIYVVAGIALLGIVLYCIFSKNDPSDNTRPGRWD